MQRAVPNIEELFFAARELKSPGDRSAFLDRACSDPGARCRVEELLAVDSEANDFLAAPASMPTVTAAHDPRSAIEEPGTAIGPYKLMEQIGEGGMGVVYVAEQHEPVRRRVALKVIKPGMDSKQVVARFEAERQALAMMDHPNIAKVHDAGMTPSGRPYFVMELVRGLPITDYCDAERLPIRERLELFVLVCRAVQHAHQKGIIHRDLKPSNILVTLLDGVPVPKVIDFGIAKATGQSLTEKTVFTAFTQLVGTPLYMSPEQVEMSGLDVDTRSDIYALGVLLYEMLTGTTPFDSETLRKAAFDELRRIIREDEPPRPSTRLSSLGATLTTTSAKRSSDPRNLNRTVQGELDWIVMKALEKDRRRRYETANDFASDVMRYLTDQPVQACPPSAVYRFRKFARRNRAALVTGAMFTLVLVAGMAVSAWQAVRATRAERRAEARSEQARQAVDEMYTQVAEKWLAGQPTMTVLQRQFLEKALSLYESFATETGSSPQVQAEALKALNRAGAIRCALGRFAEAEEAGRQVVARSTDLVRIHPDQREFSLELALGHVQLAEALRRTDRKKEAGEEAVQAYEELTKLRAVLPAEVAFRQRLAQTLDQACVELIEAVRRPESAAAVRWSLELWEELARGSPDDLESRYGLANAHLRQGRQLMWWNSSVHGKEAENSLRQAEALLSTLLREHPGDPRFRDSLGHVLLLLGRILHVTRRGAEASEVQRQAIAILEALADDFPDVPSIGVRLAVVLGNQVGTLKTLGQLRESEEVCRKELAILEQLAERYPDDPTYVSEAEVSWSNLAGILMIRGEFDESRRISEQRRDRARDILRARPGDRDALYALRRHAWLLASISVDHGDHATAARLILEDLAPYGEILDDTDADARGNRALAFGGILVRCIAAAEKDPDLVPERRAATARAYADKLNEMARRAVSRGTPSPEILSKLADLLSTAPSPTARDPALILELAQKAAAMKPDDHMVQQALAWAKYRNGDWEGCIEFEMKTGHPNEGGFFLAMAYWQRGDRSMARTWYDRADEWLQGFESRWKGNEDEVHPSPGMLRLVRAEAAALLGEDRPAGRVVADPVPGTTCPPG